MDRDRDRDRVEARAEAKTRAMTRAMYMIWSGSERIIDMDIAWI